MCFVPVKSVDQQAGFLHHRARYLLVRQRTMLVKSDANSLVTEDWEAR